MTRPNSSHTGKRRRNRSRAEATPSLTGEQRAACEEQIGYRFRDPKLLDRAMTHRSASAGRTAELSNERLEFLGDRVLGLIVAEALMLRFPMAREGDLAPRLNGVVSREACAEVGALLDLGSRLIVDKSERSSGAAARRTLLANAAEALLGAVYLDGGLRQAEKFVLRHWGGLLGAVGQTPRDPKSALQEWAQGRGLATPAYSHDARSGPDHAPLFTATVMISGHAPVSANGPSKQLAEREAARKMLETIHGAAL